MGKVNRTLVFREPSELTVRVTEKKTGHSSALSHTLRWWGQGRLLRGLWGRLRQSCRYGDGGVCPGKREEPASTLVSPQFLSCPPAGLRF